MVSSSGRMPKYKIGDRVKINVGGPDMVIYQVNDSGIEGFKGNYKCQWFAGKKLDNGIFQEDSLVSVSEEKTNHDS